MLSLQEKRGVTQFSLNFIIKYPDLIEFQKLPLARANPKRDDRVH